MFIILTSGFTQIGVKFLGAKSGAAHISAGLVLAGGITFLDPACSNLGALSKNVEVQLVVGDLVDDKHNINATPILTILS